MTARPPVEGARFLFERERVADEQVDYGVSAAASDALHEGTAHIRLHDGEITVVWRGTNPPSWIEDTVQGFLKTAFSAWKRSDVADKASLWPRRIQRWRAPREDADTAARPSR